MCLGTPLIHTIQNRFVVMYGRVPTLIVLDLELSICDKARDRHDGILLRIQSRHLHMPEYGGFKDEIVLLTSQSIHTNGSLERNLAILCRACGSENKGNILFAIRDLKNAEIMSSYVFHAVLQGEAAQAPR